MIRHWRFACLTAGFGLALACEKGSNVEAETRDLAEAQNNTGNVAKDLEGQLEKARAEVIALENKLGLARQGITDDVLEQRKQLQGALEAHRLELQNDITEAQREAQALHEQTDRAIQQLQQTQAQVENRLDTQTDVLPGEQSPLDSPTREEIAPVRGVDTPPPAEPPPAPPTVDSTTSTSPPVPPSAPVPAPPSTDPAPAPVPAPSTDPAPVTPVPAP